MTVREEPLFACKGVRVSVAGKEIVKGVDLVVGAGEKHALMGPNGSGKSTLAAALIGHPDYAVEGEIDGCTLECWLHGSRFDLRTGNPSGPPATVPVPTYPVSVEGDTVFVTVA